MFDSLMTFVVVLLLLVWILDALGVLELVSVLVELGTAVVTGVLFVVTWAVRKAIAARKSSPPLPSPESRPRGGRAGSGVSRKPPSD